MHGLTTKGRYATRLLVYLAAKEENVPVKKQEIAEAEGITPDYVEQILMRLKSAGFVRSHRGKAGGFSLALNPESISVASVLEAMEGKMTVAPCSDKSSCCRAGICPTRDLWQRAGWALRQVLDSTTIGELARKSGDAIEFEI